MILWVYRVESECALDVHEGVEAQPHYCVHGMVDCNILPGKVVVVDAIIDACDIR